MRIFHYNSGTPGTITTKLDIHMTYYIEKKYCGDKTLLTPLGVGW